MKTLEQISLEFGYNPIEFSKQYVEHLINLLKSIDHSAISKCISILENARKNDNTIFVIGNGGSASTASHIGNDFGLAVLKRSENKLLKSYRVLALTDNNSVMSAIGNDSNFNDIFIDQLKVHYRKGDKLIVISASGNSPNLINACNWFKEQGGESIGWLGFDGGKLQHIVNLPLIVYTEKGEYAPVEDIHLIFNHIIVTWMQYNITQQNL